MLLELQSRVESELAADRTEIKEEPVGAEDVNPTGYSHSSPLKLS
jgi:hypothetical protein